MSPATRSVYLRMRRPVPSYRYSASVPVTFSSPSSNTPSESASFQVHSWTFARRFQASYVHRRPRPLADRAPAPGLGPLVMFPGASYFGGSHFEPVVAFREFPRASAWSSSP